MAATCFPYGFPTGHSRSHPALGRVWPRCVSAEPGSFGHECGQPATFVALNASTGLQDLSTQTNQPRIIQFSLRLSW